MNIPICGVISLNEIIERREFMKKIGFIDHYLHQWHADNVPGWIEEATNGEMKVCYAWAEVDSPREGGITNVEWAKKFNVELCDNQEEVIEKSDYLIVMAPDNSERHEDLCKLPLASGKPTYVDKTFSVGLDDGKRIIANAVNTPFFSTSALRYDEDLCSINKNNIEVIDFRGPGTFGMYTIHMLEPLYIMMGKAKRVLALGRDNSPTLLYDFGDQRRAVLNYVDFDTGFSSSVRYKDGNCKVLTYDSEFFKVFIKELVKFFETGIPPVDINDTLDIISMLDAGRKAVSAGGTWINIE